jgi:hypothetical protein
LTAGTHAGVIISMNLRRCIFRFVFDINFYHKGQKQFNMTEAKLRPGSFLPGYGFGQLRNFGFPQWLSTEFEVSA